MRGLKYEKTRTKPKRQYIVSFPDARIEILHLFNDVEIVPFTGTRIKTSRSTIPFTGTRIEIRMHKLTNSSLYQDNNRYLDIVFFSSVSADAKTAFFAGWRTNARPRAHVLCCGGRLSCPQL